MTRNRWFPIVCAALLAACGGGGDEEDDGELNITIGDAYNYAITNPTGAPSPLTKTVVTPGFPTNDVYTINAGTGTIRGRYVVANGNLTIADTTTYTVNWSQAGPTPAQFSVGFTAAGDFPNGNFLPSTGSFAVTWGTDTITVDYGDTVELALNGGAPIGLNPFDFNQLDVAGSSAPDWQRVAARASRALVDTLVQARGVPVFLERVYDSELDTGQVVTPCTTIPGTPPVGISQAGEVVALELGGGDQYRLTSSDCFSRSPIVQTAGFLSNGTVDGSNLITTVDDESGLLVEFGYSGSPQASGGLALDSLVQGMSETSPGVWAFTGSDLRFVGGFSIVFTYSPPQ